MSIEYVISGDTCVNKVRALRSAYVTPEEEKCRNNCEGDFYKTCVNYVPVSRTQLPIRQGKIAFLTR